MMRATHYAVTREPRAVDAVYDYIVAYKREKGGRSPTRRQIVERLGLSSTSVAQAYLDRLATAGRITLDGFGRHANIAIPGERWLAPGE